MDPHKNLPSLEEIEAGLQKRQDRLERERLRDTFAAAALTGLIANGDYSVEATPLLAYRMADAMLRERVTEPMPKEKRAEVSDGMPHGRLALTDEERVVRLPSITAATTHGLSRWEDGWMQGLRDARKALDAAGVKWEVAHE